MALIVDTLEGIIDRAAVAIERIQTFEPEEGYYVAFSGGKDSIVTLDLVRRSGVSFDAHYNWTTVDPPELARFIRAEYAGVAWEQPDETMWALIRRKGFPPTRFRRYCCEALKERGGGGRFVVTGVRAAESSRRSRRGLVEACKRDAGKRLLHPIIDWSNEDVWQYIREGELPYCSLYDEGFKRLGCVMCPMQTLPQMKRDEARWPKIASAYRRAITRGFNARPPRDGGFTTGEEMYAWWLDGSKPDSMRPPQLFPMDN